MYRKPKPMQQFSKHLYSTEFTELKSTSEKLPSEISYGLVQTFSIFINEYKPYITEENKDIRHNIRSILYNFSNDLYEFKVDYELTLHDLKTSDQQCLVIDNKEISKMVLYYMDEVIDFLVEVINYLHSLYFDLKYTEDIKEYIEIIETNINEMIEQKETLTDNRDDIEIYFSKFSNDIHTYIDKKTQEAKEAKKALQAKQATQSQQMTESEKNEMKRLNSGNLLRQKSGGLSSKGIQALERKRTGGILIQQTESKQNDNQMPITRSGTSQLSMQSEIIKTPKKIIHPNSTMKITISPQSKIQMNPSIRAEALLRKKTGEISTIIQRNRANTIVSSHSIQNQKTSILNPSHLINQQMKQMSSKHIESVLKRKSSAQLKQELDETFDESIPEEKELKEEVNKKIRENFRERLVLIQDYISFVKQYEEWLKQ